MLKGYISWFKELCKIKRNWPNFQSMEAQRGPATKSRSLSWEVPSGNLMVKRVDTIVDKIYNDIYNDFKLKKKFE